MATTRPSASGQPSLPQYTPKNAEHREEGAGLGEPQEEELELLAGQQQRHRGECTESTGPTLPPWLLGVRLRLSLSPAVAGDLVRQRVQRGADGRVLA